MNKRIICIFCAIIIAFTLCGCQLAREDGFDAEPDRLVGVFVTKEYLDLFDIEGYLNDNISLFNGGKINIDNNDERYNGQVYAELESRFLINEETGEEFETQEYVFDNLDGFPFFLSRITEPDGSNYTTTSGDSAICDSQAIMGDQTMLEGTIYIDQSKLRTLYINPVYQSGDNRVYLKSGQGISLFGNQGVGSSITQSLEEKQTITENGEKTEKSFKVTIKVALENAMTGLNIIQMKPDHTPAGQQNYLIDALPGKVEINPQAAYIITETRLASESGEVIQREILEPENDRFINYRVVRDDGIFETVSVELVWDR